MPDQNSEPLLSPDQEAALRKAGRGWSQPPAVGNGGGPAFVDPDLDVTESRGRRGERYVRVVRSKKQGFEKVAPGWLQATSRTGAPKNGLARVRARLRNVILGTPLATHQAAHERLTKLKALAVLSSDALSSVAYATDQILLTLILVGTVAAYTVALPIAGAILLLLIIVVLSYRQTIRAYPKGGGSYIVASDNLGPIAGLVAGCALMSSYTMTVAVSVASGADQIVSASHGSLEQWRIPMCVGFIVLLLLGNLRGIRESGSIFMLPTYAFILAVVITVGTVAVRLATGDLHHHDPVLARGVEVLGPVLILRAFSSGASALTGVEAISDGVPAFQPEEWVNARKTLTWLGIILGAMFLGITACTFLLGLVPSNNSTLMFQLATTAFGDGAGSIAVVVATTGILVLAGNTAFSDFPRLLFFMSRDDYAPHQFKRLGDRLGFSNGILVLGGLSALVVVLFGASVPKMIPLYAIGVFTAFTMSQAGMCVRWLRTRERGWRKGLAMNILGVAICFTVFLINAIFKFTEGAWIIIALVPILVLGAIGVNRHYNEVSDHLATEIPTSPEALKPVCIVPIADLNGVAFQSLAMARTISDHVIAVHICDDEAHIAKLRAQWDAWGNHVSLEIIESPYRSFQRPLLAYIDAIDRQRRDDTIVIVLPELVATRWWHQLLHNQTALRLKGALLFRPGTVVVSVPYHLRHGHQHRRKGGRRRWRAGDGDDPEAI
ncbi:MAG: APC family permease [Candidatus Dormibacteria bacterium]